MKTHRSDMAYTAGLIYDHIVHDAKEPHLMTKDEFLQRWKNDQRHRARQAERDLLAEEDIDEGLEYEYCI